MLKVQFTFNRSTHSSKCINTPPQPPRSFQGIQNYIFARAFRTTLTLMVKFDFYVYAVKIYIYIHINTLYTLCQYIISSYMRVRSLQQMRVPSH